MTNKRIVWTDPNGMVRVTTPDPKSMRALTGKGGMLHYNYIKKQTAAYTQAGMDISAARKLAEGYATGGLDETDALDLVWQRTEAVYASRGIDRRNTVVIEKAALPYFGSFGRGAWRQDGPNAPVFDMARALPIKTSQIRLERNNRIKQAGIDYQNADIVGDSPNKIKIGENIAALKDLPATIQPDLDAIDTPEALEAWQPNWP